MEQRMNALEKENAQLKSSEHFINFSIALTVSIMILCCAAVSDVLSRLSKLEAAVGKLMGSPPAAAAETAPTSATCDDDDFDLFESEDEEEDQQRKERLATYTEKKSKSK